MLVNSSIRLGTNRVQANCVAVFDPVPSCGGIIGINRKSRQGTSGERTRYLRCLVACILLLLPVTGWATRMTVDAASDLPYSTPNTYDTVNVTVNGIIYTGSGAAITLNQDHCVLNLNGNTLYVMNGSGVNVSGDTCTVLNGTLEQHPTSTATGIDIVNVGTGRRRTTFNNVSVHARGHDCGGLFSYNAIELEINGGNWTSYVKSFVRRDYAETAPIRTDESSVDVYNEPQGEFRTWIHHIRIDSCPHMAISLRGGKMLVDSNYVSVDGQNTLYTYPSDDMMHGWANNYAILLGRVGPGSRILGNTVRSGTNHGGGRGISIGGSADNTYGVSLGGCLEIAYNDVNVHAGPDPNYGTLYVTHGFHIKGLGHDSLYIHHNTIAVSADTALATTHTGPKAGALWLMEGGVFWRIEHNTLRAIGTPGLYGYRSSSSTCGPYTECGSSVQAVVFDALGSTTDPANVHDSIVFRFNRIESNVLPIAFGGRSTGGGLTAGEEIRFYGDTIHRIAPDYADEWGNDGAIAMSLSSGDCENNYMTDVVFPADSTVDWDGDGPGELTFQRLFKITVLGNDGVPFEGARVRVRNAHGRSVVIGTTGIDGKVDDFAAAVRYLHRGVGSDSTYSPFTISAIFGADSVAMTETNVGLRTNLNDTLRLLNNGGTGELDTIPPSMVGDLSAAPAAVTGHLTFGWTSTGDDGTVGTASYDSIRYSTAPINDGNWAFATVYPRTVAPKASGVPDQIDIAAPTPVNGQYYYVGIRAYDNLRNASPLAVTSGFARGILRPRISTDTTFVNEGAQQVTFFASAVPSYLEHYYEFQLDLDINFGSPTTVTDTDPGTYAEATFPLPAEGETVMLRCRAVALDQSETSPWSPTRAFSVSGGYVNAPPSTPVAYSPVADDIVTSLRPTLVVNNSVDPEMDVLTYEFAVLNAAGSSTLASSGLIAQASPRTTWSVPAGVLQDTTDYMWRARSFDGEAYSSWMTPAPFSVHVLATGNTPSEIVVRAYPNPVHFASGERATFVLPDDPVDLTIITVSGNVVLFRSDLSGQWQWDGANQSGSQVAPGVYPWFLSGDQGHGKLVVKP